MIDIPSLLLEDDHSPQEDVNRPCDFPHIVIIYFQTKELVVQHLIWKLTARENELKQLGDLALHQRMVGNGVGIVNLINLLNDDAADLVPDHHWDFLILIVISLQCMPVITLILDSLSDELYQHFHDLYIKLSPELLRHEDEQVVEVRVLDFLVDVFVGPEECREEMFLADAVTDAVYALQCADLQREA